MMAPVTDAPEDRDALDLLVALGDTEIVRDWWRPDGSSTAPGSKMGDGAASDAISVRLTNRYVPHGHITAHYYVRDMRGNADSPGPLMPFQVRVYVEYFLADQESADPNAAEIGTDVETYSYETFSSLRQAEASRDRLAASMTGRTYRWNGTLSDIN